MINVKNLQAFATEANIQISRGAKEDALRALLISRLEHIFPDSPWWLKVHVIGWGTYLQFSQGLGQQRYGLADSIVGKTAIEYEKDLSQTPLFDEGYRQVKEYCAGLCNQNKNLQHDEVLGVLSDTIRWYGYRIQISGKSQGLLGADDIELIQEDFIDLSQPTDAECRRFEKFISKYLARSHSRFLKAETLANDFGVKSEVYSKFKEQIQDVLNTAQSSRPDYFTLIKSIWHSFIEQAGLSASDEFLETYADELYLITLAKILCANILKGDSIISEPAEVVQILDGSFFVAMKLDNLVDYDYFGWLNEGEYSKKLAGIAIEIQRALVAYDFRTIQKQDLFGCLLAELATERRRQLLGQERTPPWLARAMVKKVLKQLPSNTPPHMLDMCCGAGVFIVEGLQAIREMYDIAPEHFSPDKDKLIFSSVTGFDIDPLAIMLAKVNWILSMRDLFPCHSGKITIPIFHADSLFLSTPIARNMPASGGGEYELQFDKETISLPAFLVSTEQGNLFDCVVAKAYRLAMTRANKYCEILSADTVDLLLNSIITETDCKLSQSNNEILREFLMKFVQTLEDLQRNGRNGIWSFVLSNSYRPGLLSQQFNCLVSNPPWLTMSHLADNPYKESLTELAKRLGIKPAGNAFPHLELATTFLLSSVLRYLKENSPWGCVLPSTITTGQNHAKLREEKYRSAPEPVDMRTSEIWELPVSAFSNKACVLFGEKSKAHNPNIIDGRVWNDEKSFVFSSWRLAQLGTRSAWVKSNSPIIQLQNHPQFTQGADLMPREALFHEFSIQPNGDWTISPILGTSSIRYLIANAHNPCHFGKNLRLDGFDSRCIYWGLLSSHLYPFHMLKPVRIMLPFLKRSGSWMPITDMQLAMMNASTQWAWNGIVGDAGSIADLTQQIDQQNKLSRQVFCKDCWLVVYGAGGQTPCAAYIPLSNLECERLSIDQTLYWHMAETEDEAVYLVGLINSEPLRDLIRPFQPEGKFGCRHIHTLPRDVIPLFDPANHTHAEVVRQTRLLQAEWNTKLLDPTVGRLLSPGSIIYNRPRLQSTLQQLTAYRRYNDACKALYTELESSSFTKKVITKAQFNTVQPDANKISLAAHQAQTDYDPNA